MIIRFQIGTNGNTQIAYNICCNDPAVSAGNLSVSDRSAGPCWTQVATGKRLKHNRLKSGELLSNNRWGGGGGLVVAATVGGVFGCTGPLRPRRFAGVVGIGDRSEVWLKCVRGVSLQEPPFAPKKISTQVSKKISVNCILGD